jgi:hypothetical protein
MADAPEFKPGELEEACALVHLLFEALPTAIAEHALRACWRTRGRTGARRTSCMCCRSRSRSRAGGGDGTPRSTLPG